MDPVNGKHAPNGPNGHSERISGDVTTTGQVHRSGQSRTSTLADWRFGERSDIDQITREEAKWFAEKLGLGQFVR